jgi:hypothetical protein
VHRAVTRRPSGDTALGFASRLNKRDPLSSIFYYAALRIPHSPFIPIPHTPPPYISPALYISQPAPYISAPPLLKCIRKPRKLFIHFSQLHTFQVLQGPGLKTTICRPLNEIDSRRMIRRVASPFAPRKEPTFRRKATIRQSPIPHSEFRTPHPPYFSSVISFTGSIIFKVAPFFSAPRLLRKMRKLEKSSNIFKSLQYFQISTRAGR